MGQTRNDFRDSSLFHKARSVRVVIDTELLLLLHSLRKFISSRITHRKKEKNELYPLILGTLKRLHCATTGRHRVFLLWYSFTTMSVDFATFISYLLKVVDEGWLDLRDVPVPEVVDDPGEVDVVRQGPGDVLADAGRRLEALGDALDAALVEQPGVDSAPPVHDVGALVGPHLGNAGQFGIPSAGEERDK